MEKKTIGAFIAACGKLTDLRNKNLPTAWAFPIRPSADGSATNVCRTFC